MASEQQQQWVECVVDNDYEMLSHFPFTIRRKSNHKVVKESRNNYGYICCHVNGMKYLKHRIIALQFLHNDDPENKTEIDHINHDRTDYHIENLRWCTRNENQRNKTSAKGIQFALFDEIPVDEDDEDNEIIKVDHYGTHEFNNLYFYKNYFYAYNGIQYRRVTIKYNSAGNACIQMIDTNHKNTTINYIVFKNMYDLN